VSVYLGFLLWFSSCVRVRVRRVIHSVLIECVFVQVCERECAVRRCARVCCACFCESVQRTLVTTYIYRCLLIYIDVSFDIYIGLFVSVCCASFCECVQRISVHRASLPFHFALAIGLF